VNTLALSVFERTREIGMLRAVGMSRRQLRRVVRGESLIIAAIGGVVGLAVGLLWGWAFTTALESEDIAEFTVPTGRTLAFVAISVLAGVVAAVLPAWRASRLDVLDAIATE
jgi:putative ABC transport system permease protein